MSGIEFNLPYREFRKKVPFLPVREMGSRYALDFDGCTFDRDDLESRAQTEFSKLYRSGGFEARGIKLDAFIEKALGQLLKEKFPGDANHFILSKDASIFLIKTSSFFNLDGLLREFHKSGIKKLIELEEALNWTSVLSDYPELRDEYPNGAKPLSDTVPGSPAFSMDYEDSSFVKPDPKPLQGSQGRFGDPREQPTGAVRPKRRFLSEVARTPSFGDDISQEASLFDGSPDSGFYLKAPVGANDADKRALEMYQKARREIDLHFSAGDRVGLAGALSSRIPGSPLEDLVKSQPKAEDDVFSFKTDSSAVQANSTANPFVDETPSTASDSAGALPGILDFYGARGASPPELPPDSKTNLSDFENTVSPAPAFEEFKVEPAEVGATQESISEPLENPGLEALFEDSGSTGSTESVRENTGEHSFESTFASFGDGVVDDKEESSGAAASDESSFTSFGEAFQSKEQETPGAEKPLPDERNEGFSFPAFDVAQPDSQTTEAIDPAVFEDSDFEPNPGDSSSAFSSPEKTESQGHPAFDGFEERAPQATVGREFNDAEYLPNPYFDEPEQQNVLGHNKPIDIGQDSPSAEQASDEVVIAPNPYGFGVPSFELPNTDPENADLNVSAESSPDFKDNVSDTSFTPFDFESAGAPEQNEFNQGPTIDQFGFGEDEPLEGYVLGKKESE